MDRRRALGPALGATVTVALLAILILAPAVVGRSVKDAYHGLPGPVTTLVPDAFESGVGRSLDDAVRFFSFGNAGTLIQGDLRAVEATPSPSTWSPQRTVHLTWKGLGSGGVQYEVRYAPTGDSFQTATVAGLTREPEFNVNLPGDGSFTVYAQPQTDSKKGYVSKFGPFLVDATPPPPPLLEPRGNPPGYRFQINWTGSSDLSGILGYEVERSLNGGPWVTLARVPATTLLEEQAGNGQYSYRVRAVNGAGLRSEASNPINVVVIAPMQNPGPGGHTYGIQANYTGFLYLWDLSDMDQYVSIDDVPAAVKQDYLGAGYGIELTNGTLVSIVKNVIGQERNTAKIAERLFIYLFDQTDYDSAKLAAGGNLPLQTASHTLDLAKGICGDLAVLYLTLLRIAGVPARPVHGYLDNTLAGVGGFHMWVEVYVGPANAQRPWMTVDVSGVSGDPLGDHKFKPEYLFVYFGIFNPDYLALGVEAKYPTGYKDNSWNTWARFSYRNPATRPTPIISDKTTVTEYASEEGCLYFNTETRKTKYVTETASGGCPNEPGFTNYYRDIKRVSKKLIDYGAAVEDPPGLPSCLDVYLRYPETDEFGATNPDQSVIFNTYHNSSSPFAEKGDPSPDGWLKFTDGQSSNC